MTSFEYRNCDQRTGDFAAVRFRLEFHRRYSDIIMLLLLHERVAIIIVQTCLHKCTLMIQQPTEMRFRRNVYCKYHPVLTAFRFGQAISSTSRRHCHCKLSIQIIDSLSLSFALRLCNDVKSVSRTF